MTQDILKHPQHNQTPPAINGSASGRQRRITGAPHPDPLTLRSVELNDPEIV